jgi:hypothetical protein
LQGPQLVFGRRVLVQQRRQFLSPYCRQILPNLVGIVGLRYQGGMGVKFDADSGLPGQSAVTEQLHHFRSSGLPSISGHRGHQHRGTSLRDRRPLAQRVPIMRRDTT